MAVGDVNSDAKGSGARFNTGKVPVELLPFRILALTTEQDTVKEAFYKLDAYQFSGDVRYLESLFQDVQHHWTDCAWVFDYGKRKYSEWNWLRGMSWSIPLACAGRHLMKIRDGELLDEESGLSHWGHLMCNLVMLIMYAEVYPEGNDLPKKPVSEHTEESPVNISADNFYKWSIDGWKVKV